MKNRYFLIIILTLSFSVYSNNSEILKRALQKIDYDENLFSYESRTETTEKDGVKITIFRFDPKLDEPYTILNIDNKVPTEKEIKKFRERKEEEQGRSGFNDLLGSEYKFLSEDNGLAKFSFISRENLIPNKESKMNGTVWVDLKDEVITKIELKNRDKINVAFTVTMKSFVMTFNFKKFNDNFSVVERMNIHVAGKAAIIEFDHRSDIYMYNYELI